MVLMVLDHARDFFFGLQVRPTDLGRTTVLLFFTRWVTHFCAPVFIFLAGTAAYLYGIRHGRQQLSRYLVTRGFWLVLLEITVVRLGWLPDPAYHFTLIQVIWTLGWSMVLLAALSRLPTAALAAFGLALVAGHHLLDVVDKMNLGALSPLWIILHKRGSLEPFAGHRLFISYALLPWVGVMALGYVAGTLFNQPPADRTKWLWRLGLGATAAFVIVRGVNGYGDPVRWVHHARGPVYTLLSFLNCEKYPPSLCFVLMTLGPALCALAAFDGVAVPRFAQPLIVFGRVPLLFYLAHLFLLRYVSVPMALSRWGADALQPPPGHAGSPEYGLWTAYVAAVAALFLLYPLCRWFMALKERRQDWWLGYL